METPSTGPAHSPAQRTGSTEPHQPNRPADSGWPSEPTPGVVRIAGVELGAGRPKIVVPLMPRASSEVAAAVAALHGQPVDVIEWRVDHVTDPERAAAVGVALRTETGLPVLMTYRTDREGGQGTLADADYAALLRRLLRLDLADAVDVEYRRDPVAVASVVNAAHAAGLPVITSFHDFDSTPDLESLLGTLREQAASGGDVLKMAVTPRTALDVATLLTASATAASHLPQHPLISISMGSLGLVSRVAAETFGSCATFASVGESSAPGQLPAATLAPLLGLFSRD